MMPLKRWPICETLNYLLKPFSFERFLKAIHKIDAAANKEKTIFASPTDKEIERVFVKSGKKYIQLKLDTILFIEAVGNYCKITTLDEAIQVREKISVFIKQLPQSLFFQVHKSFIVSKTQISAIEGNRILIKDYVIPIGKVYKANLNRLLQ